MNRLYSIPRLAGLIALLVTVPARAEEKLERGKDRIDVPAMGPGLWVHNLFQSNMVIQRDKPIRVWGWSEPGENVTVTFGGQSQSTTAAADRSWMAELPAMPANPEPRTIVIQGKDKKALHCELVERRGSSRKPCLLARSRGGLMAYNWAAEHPESVGGLAGIYPVCNLRSWPGLDKACGAYGLTVANSKSSWPSTTRLTAWLRSPECHPSRSDRRPSWIPDREELESASVLGFHARPCIGGKSRHRRGPSRSPADQTTKECNHAHAIGAIPLHPHRPAAGAAGRAARRRTEQTCPADQTQHRLHPRR